MSVKLFLCVSSENSSINNFVGTFLCYRICIKVCRFKVQNLH